MAFKNYPSYTTIPPEPSYSKMDFLLDLIDDGIDITPLELDEYIDTTFIEDEERQFKDLLKHEPTRRND